METTLLATDPAQKLAVRLRLKRHLLVAMIVSLAAGAAIAIGVFLFGSFNQTTARILGSLAGLAAHCAIAMALAAAIEKRRVTRLCTAGLVLFGVNYVVLFICIWSPPPTSWADDLIFRGILTTLALLGYFVLAIPGAALWEARRWQPLPKISLAACAFSLAMVLLCIWSSWRHPNEEFARATSVAGVVAFSLAHTCLLGRVPVARQHGWLLTGTIGCVWIVAVMVSYMIVASAADEFAMRLLGTIGVLDAAGSLLLAILAKLKQVTSIQQLESVPARVELVCPRCTTPQTVDAGPSRCTACGLKFRIDIEEPRCSRCGYLLWRLPERRCPECGQVF